MEKAILKTLLYSDIFDYPLKAWEIHKWLVEKDASLKDVEMGITKLLKKKEIQTKLGYYFLKSREVLVNRRIKREMESKRYLRQITILSKFFRLIPFVNLIGVSGSLAMMNTDRAGDIDLLVITQKNRIWFVRVLMLLFVQFLGKRRSRRDVKKEVAGKICINLMLEVDKLIQSNKNLYLAHEILQMKVLWQKKGVYAKYLEDNSWVFRFLPNWINGEGWESEQKVIKRRFKSSKSISLENGGFNYQEYLDFLMNKVENLMRWLQLKYMGKPEAKERIYDGALYFHPQDYTDKILWEYKKRIKEYKII